MLRDVDLQLFLNAFVMSKDAQIAPASPRDVLRSEDGLFPAEIRRLGCSLEIAAVLGDAPSEATAAAGVILNEVRDLRCHSLDNHDSWCRAIAWARAQLALTEAAAYERRGRDREAAVGAACLRLRKRGYKIEIQAYGPQIADASRREIVNKLDALIALLGGLPTVTQILRFLRDAKFYHDGMWLFGEVGLNLYDEKRPMLPVGWLCSLALRHLTSDGSARKPEVAWKSLVELATDFAAAHDCQRYSQFEEIDLHPAQFHRALVNSLLWREFFTLQQVPANVLRQVLDALATTLGPDDERRLGFSFRALVREILQLVSWSADDRLTVLPVAQVRQSLPLLCRVVGSPVQSVNKDFGDPLAAATRNQDNVLLFACGADRAVTLPRSFLAAAVCVQVFGLIWAGLDRSCAEMVVGETLEQAIAEACKGKAPTVIVRREYHVGGRRYELDVATRDQDRIVFIETKGKSLTKQSRSGDMFAFFRDYSDSFLTMLCQLTRHEVHLKEGKTPLTSSGETLQDLRPLKIAVSPLSYGPLSDKLLSSGVLRSLAGAKITLVAPDSKNQGVVDVLNKRVQEIIRDIARVAPKRDGVPEVFAYLLDVFWLDLGQLLYILDRANTVWDAFWPLRHITFSSRDFWTELAQADRGGLTRGRWRPAS
jgi:hypothetical protein